MTIQEQILLMLKLLRSSKEDPAKKDIIIDLTDKVNADNPETEFPESFAEEMIGIIVSQADRSVRAHMLNFAERVFLKNFSDKANQALVCNALLSIPHTGRISKYPAVVKKRPNHPDEFSPKNVLFASKHLN
ncbi:MAG: hypothetical protein GXO77_08705 [Calditrichaeota bacterium]|nr:hypothetical protein [Calditrichota bacterium]